MVNKRLYAKKKQIIDFEAGVTEGSLTKKQREKCILTVTVDWGTADDLMMQIPRQVVREKAGGGIATDENEAGRRGGVQGHQSIQGMRNQSETTCAALS